MLYLILYPNWDYCGGRQDITNRLKVHKLTFRKIQEKNRKIQLYVLEANTKSKQSSDLFCNLLPIHCSHGTNLMHLDTAYQSSHFACHYLSCHLHYTFRGGSRAAATSKMECFAIIVNGWKPLTIITKHSILDVAAALDLPQTFEYVYLHTFQFNILLQRHLLHGCRLSCLVHHL